MTGTRQCTISCSVCVAQYLASSNFKADLSFIEASGKSHSSSRDTATNGQEHNSPLQTLCDARAAEGQRIMGCGFKGIYFCFRVSIQYSDRYTEAREYGDIFSDEVSTPSIEHLTYQ